MEKENMNAQNETIFDSEPSMEKISDYHKPMASSKKKTLFFTMAAGLALGFLVYFIFFTAFN